MWALVGGFAGATRMAIGACVAVVLMYIVVIPLERSRAVRGLVTEYRAKSAEAERDELRRQVSAGQIVIDAYQVQLRNVRAKEEAATNELEQRIFENEALRTAGGRSCAMDDADVKFLLNDR